MRPAWTSGGDRQSWEAGALSSQPNPGQPVALQLPRAPTLPMALTGPPGCHPPHLGLTGGGRGDPLKDEDRSGRPTPCPRSRQPARRRARSRRAAVRTPLPPSSTNRPLPASTPPVTPGRTALRTGPSARRLLWCRSSPRVQHVHPAQRPERRTAGGGKESGDGQLTGGGLHTGLGGRAERGGGSTRLLQGQRPETSPGAVGWTGSGLGGSALTGAWTDAPRSEQPWRAAEQSLCPRAEQTGRGP